MADAPYLIVSDTQIPFEAPKALEFVLYVKRHYKIPDENMIHAGDELDNYHGGRWPKDPNGKYSAVGELAEAKDRLKRWYSALPKMKLCLSNHGTRWIKKSAAAEIPSQLMRSYEEIIEAPDLWIWKHEWVFKDGKMPWRVTHGCGYNGVNGAKNAAIDAQISTAIGHLHSHAGISYLNPRGGNKLWAFNVGSLIDVEAYAFEYGKESRLQPCLGIGVICNQGTTPIWIPYS